MNAKGQGKSNIVRKVEAQLAELREEYIQKLPKKLQLVNEVWQKLTYFSWNDDAFNSLYRLVHNLTGSSKTFGFEQLSVEAKKLNDCLAPLTNSKRQPTDKERVQIESLINSMAQAASLRPQNSTTLELPEPNEKSAQTRANKIVFVVDDDREICLYINALLSDVGYQVRNFANPVSARDYVHNCVPDAVIMDIMFPNNGVAGFEYVNDIRSIAGRRVPFIFISARTDLAARTNVVRAGGDAYFTKPLDFNALLKKLDQVLEQQLSEQCRILIVDDDAELSQFYALVLKKANMKTMIVNEPIKTIQTIESFGPDLILMDLYMPQYNGLELAGVIRQDEKYIGLPIVFLSSEARETYHDQAFTLGVNEFLVKPIIPELLVSTITKQIKLSQPIRDSIRKISKCDPYTGLYNRQYFLQQLETAIASLTGGTEHQALLDISIDNFELIKEKYGIEWLNAYSQQISAVIAAQVSSPDITTQFSDSVFMVLTAKRCAQETVKLAKDIRNAISEHHLRLGNNSLAVTSSIGIIEINEHVNSVHSLLFHADEACHQAQKKGGDCFVVYEVLPDTQVNTIDIQTRINQAIDKKSFHLTFQPIVSIENRALEMYEVLLRLNDSEGRILLPAQFIPVLEQTGNMVKTDRWVIENAISSLAADSHARSAADFFIKISGKTLQESVLIPWISNSITAGGISGESRLVFHINEKDAVLYTQNAVSFSRGVEKLKCSTSIDHFGVTANSVHLLDAIKPDFVKLRATVTEGILIDSKKLSYVKMLVESAMTRNIKVIASSIEDPATLSLLWDLGIRYFQGFFIQEPTASLKYNFQHAVM